MPEDGTIVLMGHDPKRSGVHSIYTCDPTTFGLTYVATIGGDMKTDLLGAAFAYDHDAKDVYVSYAGEDAKGFPYSKFVAVSLVTKQVQPLNHSLMSAPRASNRLEPEPAARGARARARACPRRTLEPRAAARSVRPELRRPHEAHVRHARAAGGRRHGPSAPRRHVRPPRGRRGALPPSAAPRVVQHGVAGRAHLRRSAAAPNWRRRSPRVRRGRSRPLHAPLGAPAAEPPVPAHGLLRGAPRGVPRRLELLLRAAVRRRRQVRLVLLRFELRQGERWPRPGTALRYTHGPAAARARSSSAAPRTPPHLPRCRRAAATTTSRSSSSASPSTPPRSSSARPSARSCRATARSTRRARGASRSRRPERREAAGLRPFTHFVLRRYRS